MDVVAWTGQGRNMLSPNSHGSHEWLNSRELNREDKKIGSELADSQHIQVELM